MDETKQCLSEIVDDALGIITDVASIVSKAFYMWRQKNIDIAREVLLTNIRQGDVEAIHKDELFSMLSRFSRSVQEGVAKSNLILMARLISGIGQVDKNIGKAETFSQYVDMLEHLTEEEILTLSKIIKTGKIIGDNETLQSLQYKGFLNSESKSTVTTNSGIVIRKTEAENIPNSARRVVDEGSNFKQSPVNIYDVDTKVEYTYTSRFQKLLDRYGNLWEDISRWADKKDVDNE